jgi:hypothetical protein
MWVSFLPIDVIDEPDKERAKYGEQAEVLVIFANN